MNDEKTLYRERTPWPGWAAAGYWGAILLVAGLMMVGYDTDLPATTRGLIAAVMLLLAAAVGQVIAGLTVLVQETRLYVFLGTYPLIKRVIPYREILGMKSVEYSPIGEFGGWGARGVGRKKAWTARGNQAVVLTLTDNREVYLGSDHPRRLEERIRTTAGDQLGEP